MKTIVKTGLVAFVVLIVAACSDNSGHAPVKLERGDSSTLEGAVTNFVLDKKQCVEVVKQWPASPAPGSPAEGRLESLVDAGLVTVDASGGKKVFKPAKDDFQIENGSQWLCFGQPVVVSVSGEQNVEAGPGTVKEVSFGYQLGGTPAWVSNEKVKKAFPLIAQRTAGEVRESQFFEKQDGKWVIAGKKESDAFFGTEMKKLR